jgi:hypothetical protein
LSDEVYEQLSKAAKEQDTDVSDVVRQALLTYFNGGSSHDAEMDDRSDGQATHQIDDCARALLVDCEPDTRQRIITTAEQLRLPLANVMASLLLAVSRPMGHP